ncbi:MAG: hypothetical protein IJ464_05250 [Alistipes sp.]|nr:hypothetical protein [Alistipes sp.]
MRLLNNIVTILIALTTLVGCDKETGKIFNINVEKQHSCSFDRQTVEIQYRLMGITDNDAYPKVSATASDSWVIDIDSSEQGSIMVEVEANNGALRSTTITISAPGHVATKVTLTQLSAPSDASHTLMFYFFGTSLSRYFDDNIADAKTAISTGILGDNCRVLYLRQSGKHTAHIGELCYDPVNKSTIERIITEDITIEGSIISPEAMGRHIAMLAEEAPADRYGLILAGHGHGWLTRDALNGTSDISLQSAGHNPWQPALGAEVTRAFGEYNVQVDIPELAEGIELSGVELEYILFDACFMSSVEAIYDLREVTDYIIASPCEIMGRGFPYHRTLPYLFAAGGASSDLKGAAESYYRYYRDEYTSSARCGSITLYDCAEMEDLAKATKLLAATATSDYDISTLQTYEGQSTHIFYDFGQWANTVATDTAALEAFNDQLDRTVIATYTLPSFYTAYGAYGTFPIDVTVYSGVTTSAPSSAYPNEWKTTNWYKRVWE